MAKSCVYKNVRISFLQNVSSVVARNKEKLSVYAEKRLMFKKMAEKKRHFHPCCVCIRTNLDFHTDNEFTELSVRVVD